ncbi:unnamed protein product [Schistosoma margrebowiei]|uniref:Uncharacterized protein n=1 Tax=Schistosoma margrebowiei TaxID=48269 RepID=A0A3P8CBR6_9TREM|nr:unnamed protein product [Schistosoma margrebowiei]
MGLVRWMYQNLRVDVHYGTRTQYRLLQTLSRYPISY